ncbi:MAG: hypothetical protein Q7S64_01335 [bacterium]|nr:hypothetical protein [bacterium]
MCTTTTDLFYASEESPLLDLMSDAHITRWRRPAPNLIIGRVQGHARFGGTERDRIQETAFSVVWHLPHCQSRKRGTRGDCDFWHLDPMLPIDTYEYWHIREQLAALLSPEPPLPAHQNNQPFAGVIFEAKWQQLAYHVWHRGGIEFCVRAVVRYLPGDEPSWGDYHGHQVPAFIEHQLITSAQPVSIRVVLLDQTHRPDAGIICLGSPYRFTANQTFEIWNRIAYTRLIPVCHHYQGVNRTYAQTCYHQ